MKIEIQRNKKIVNAETILERIVTPSSTTAHIYVPKKFRGRRATILIHKEDKTVPGESNLGYMKKNPGAIVRTKKQFKEFSQNEE